jgi:hypothetical protein
MELAGYCNFRSYTSSTETLQWLGIVSNKKSSEVPYDMKIIGSEAKFQTCKYMSGHTIVICVLRQSVMM